MSQCPFCQHQTQFVSPAYHSCPDCDILISSVAAATYDAGYYYMHRSSSSFTSTRAKLLFDRFQPYLSGQRRGLDFGCNDGAFVRVANAHQCRFAGVDINSFALRLAKKNSDGDFFLPHEVPSTYPLMTAFDVIEHFDELDMFFETIGRYLQPRGYLLLTTPNKNSKWHRLFNEGWHGCAIPQYHRYIFSQSFLRWQFERHRYDVETIFTVPPIETRGWKYLVASGYRLKATKGKKLFALPGSLIKFFYGKFFLSGEEDTLCVVARRRN